MLTYIAYANSFLYIKDWYITSCDIFVFCRRQEILELSDSILKDIENATCPYFGISSIRVLRNILAY